MRVPPANLEAEQALLGALLANNRAYERVADFLRAEHFADPIHATIFGAIAAKLDAGKLADAVTLRREFEHSGRLDEAGGPAYLAQLLSAMVGIINAAEYGRVIQDAWVRRQLVEVGETVVNAAHGAAGDGSDLDGLTLAQNAAAQLLDLTQQDSGDKPQRIGDVALNVLADAQLAASSKSPRGLPTGLPRLDYLIGRLQPEKLYVFAGRPGMGKSVLGMVAAYAVASCQEPEAPPGEVLVFSLEMSAGELGERLLSALSGVPGDKIRHGNMTQQEWDALEGARIQLAKQPITIDARPGLTIEQIGVRARSIMAQSKLRAVIYDHMHIIGASSNMSRASATEKMEHIAINSKRLAKALKVPVIALCQLNRGVEGREDKRATLADLKQAGAIEENADVVGFLFRESYYMERAEPKQKADETLDQFDGRHALWKAALARVQDKIEITLAKNRNGACATVYLRFDGSTSRIWQEGDGSE